MKCPACENKLTEVLVGDVEVDICKGGCGGIWFDKDEIERFDEPHDLPADEILNVPKAANPVMKKEPRQCPRCANQVLVRQIFDIQNKVEIHQCWECSGIWLDAGELGTIRSEYQSAEELKIAADSYVARCMQEHLAAIAASGKEKMAKYDEETKNRFTSFLHELGELIKGEDDLG